MVHKSFVYNVVCIYIGFVVVLWFVSIYVYGFNFVRRTCNVAAYFISKGVCKPYIVWICKKNVDI